MSELTSMSLLLRLHDSSDNQAWSAFDDRYRRFIVGFLERRHIDNHTAEDICQNVLHRVSSEMAAGGFAHNGNAGAFRNWLRKIVATQLAVFRRKVGRESALPENLEGQLAAGTCANMSLHCRSRA